MQRDVSVNFKLWPLPTSSDGVPARMVLGLMLFLYLLVVFVLTGNMGEFAWSETTQGTILSAYYWGNMLLPLPAGRLADAVGGRRVMGIALFITALFNVLTPSLARLHHGFLIAVRALQGLAMGVHYPSLVVLITRWVPQDERSRFFAICNIGPSVSIVLLSPLWGLAFAHLGWASYFYMTGGLGLGATLLWYWLVHDTPASHPRISKSELSYIAARLPATPAEPPSVPWRKIVVSSHIFDFVLSRNVFKLINMRRFAVCISHVLPALVLALLPLVATDLVPAVAIFCALHAFGSANNYGFMQAFMDIAPNFCGEHVYGDLFIRLTWCSPAAGTLMGFTHGLGSTMGIISPLIVGAILERDASVSGWHIAFALTSAIYLVSSVPYLFLFSVKMQPWNELKSKEAEAKSPAVEFVDHGASEPTTSI
ncbi:hypothetical protein B566_EDAN010444 [Ephemera danica]|nr:hypothetical protein B566_EDAN010444 [Ephemera danica]